MTALPEDDRPPYSVQRLAERWECSPSMIRKLIGLVQMLQNMEDPAAIGPAMAVALLTTFYGSVIANVFAMPVAEKLKVRSSEELAEKALIAQGLLSILSGESPRFLIDRLNVQLPPAERFQEAG